MLVKFHSSTSGEILMFADSARPILQALAKSPTARGVMTTEELPGLIRTLRTALARWRGERRPDASETNTALHVSLAQRAVPMLELLERTLDDEGYILWEAAADFAEG